MHNRPLSRREFLAGTAAVAGALSLPPASRASAPKRYASDLVPLGRTGLKISRLGMGTGSRGGRVQFELGQAAFTKLVHHAFDKGVRYFDCALSYRTHPWIGDVIKGLPRDEVFLLSKIGGAPERPGEVIDRLLQDYKTDHIDCLLVHCSVTGAWTEERRPLMDAIDRAVQAGKVRAKGVSCHSLPALRLAASSDWVQVNLVRVNPQAVHIDGETQNANASGTDLAPVLKLIGTMHANGHGVIGMKLVGNGDFTRAEDRERSIQHTLSRPDIHAVTIGCKSAAEVDEAMRRVDAALAA